MREKLKKLITYIFRSWDKEPNPPHPKLKILPPFLLELLSYLIVLAILYKLGVYLGKNI